MDKPWVKKIISILKSGLPTSKDLSLFIKVTIFALVGFTFFTIFNYTSTARAADLDTRWDGNLRGIRKDLMGCDPYLTGNIAANSASEGASLSTIKHCADLQAQNASANTAFVPLDIGAMGRVINGTASTYDVNIAQPGTTVEYYASNITGRAMAAENPTSGRSTLAPIFELNQVMVNLSYALIVIVLLVSALSILIGSLTGGEERFTIVQLMINTGITLIVITFYYEISAVIFDLCVNYGNALVASVMSPYINSYAVLDRLSPGGDLGIIAVLSTFQSAGISDSLLTVTRSISAGLYPAIAQTSAAYANSVGLKGLIPENPLTGFAYSYLLQFGSTGSTLTISAVVGSFLGNSELFNAVVEWALFFINVKIFLNLIMAFLNFCFGVAFGPAVVLGAVSGGFEKISSSFLSLAAKALVFPLSLGFILLGAGVTNITIRSDNSGDISKSTQERQVLCQYSPKDPANVENGFIKNSFWGSLADRVLPRDQSFLDPTDTRIRNYLNQNIFDATPASVTNGVEDCRPGILPRPFTYVPAPFGTIGIRSLQIQTIDSLIRSFIGIIFLILAARAPKILEESLGVKTPGFLGGIESSLKQGFSSFITVGGTAFGIGLPLTKWITGTGVKGARWAGSWLPGGNFVTGKIQQGMTSLKMLGIGYGKGRRFGGTHNAVRDKSGKLVPGTAKDPSDGYRKGKFGSGNVFSNLTTYDKRYASQVGKDMREGNMKSLEAMGFSTPEASMLAGQNIVANWDKIMKQFSAAGVAAQTFGAALEQLTGVVAKASEGFRNLIAIDAITEI